MKEQERHTHESFGLIRFSRCNGSQAFYGSELNQDSYISLEISQSEIQRDLSQDWHFTTGPQLIKLRMTSGQFAELITSMNYGSGACCTLERLNGKKIADLPHQESRKEFVHRKFEDRMKEFAKNIVSTKTDITNMLAKKTLSKADIAESKIALDSLVTEITSNIPFFGKCFQESIDEMVYEAKLEVENAIQHKVNSLGLQALHEQNKLLDQ